MERNKKFLWGAATSSYQIEGSSDEDGKGVSIWDDFVKTPGNVANGETGDEGCCHYRHWREDVALMKEMGLRAYRFSVSWCRILPEGTGKVNQAGLRFYSELIDELIKNGIEPILTLFHWDFPSALMKRGGWQNREVSDWFAEYTGVIVQAYSDRVKYWITLNEPQCFVQLGYQSGLHAPGLRVPAREAFAVAHNLLLAHGKAVRVIRENAKQPPYIGYAPALDYVIPSDDTPEAYRAAKKEMFSCSPEKGLGSTSWWTEATLRGRYPEEGMACFAQDLPRIEEGDMELISQPLDFLGINYYQGRYFPYKRVVGEAQTVNGWFIRPEGLYYMCKMLYEEYQLPILITENGLASMDWVQEDGRVKDPQRIDFISRHISYMKKAMEEGVDIRGYLYWSLMDNFEWQNGYGMRFGLIYVDYATKRRLLKDSAYWYMDRIKSLDFDLTDTR